MAVGLRPTAIAFVAGSKEGMSARTGSSPATIESITRGLILLGSALSALSAGLVWSKADPATLGVGLPALFVNESALMRRGFELRVGWISVGWIVAACGIIAAALLLWGGEAESAWIAKAQVGLGAVILLVALLHISSYFGPLTAAAGGALIISGGYLSARRGAS